ncbi:cell surface protein [Methanosarcina siciliae HI350]|uniref:Cell surface protein n=1 Tax=Methanosarcina siciliae HI350 TaxID=1434119 RepID=A0A0E3PEN6_9EURY|nr:PGF-pre-PGF domain-containing protein [Methanosarcina siciliae]AKB33039.1 cell surface protein [Methanosarcina siciliae HI350]
MGRKEKLHSIALISTVFLFLISLSSMVLAASIQNIDQLNVTEIQVTTKESDQKNPVIYGDRIVWQDYSDDYGWGGDIYMYNISTHNEIQIANNFASSPAIYEDRIVWQDFRNGNGYDIYMYNVSTSTETQITINGSTSRYPSIYGERIVWEDDRNGNGDIYMYDLSTSKEIQITTDNSSQSDPAIYGDRIVWVDQRNEKQNIYMYDITTSTETQITNDDYQVNPSIYGDTIVWEGNQNGKPCIYMYDIPTSTKTLVTTNSQSYGYFSAIHEDRIVWQDQRNGNWDIYMYNISTSMETQVTTYGSTHLYPAIYGDTIVWTDDRNGYNNWDIYMCTIPAREPETKMPVTDFIANVTNGYVPLFVQFTDLSQNITWRKWDFNNDGITDSTSRTPAYVYTVQGIYTVNLTVGNEKGTISKLLPIFAFPTQRTDDQLILTEYQITTNGADQMYPAIYGDRIAWVDNRKGWSDIDIYMHDLSTSKEIQISKNEPNQISPAIYDDKIVWDDNLMEGIYMYDLSVSEQTQISTNGFSQSSPDIYGDKIVWVDGRNGNGDIYMYNLSTHKETQITTNEYSQIRPAIYGDRIVWADYRNDNGNWENTDIYMYNLSTSTETQITTNGSKQRSLTIYGDRILWKDDNTPNSSIYMYNISTHKETQITTSATYGGGCAIYADRIVWTDRRNGNDDIYMYDLSNYKETKINNNISSKAYPAIYGDSIVWMDHRNKNWDIYLCSLSDREQESELPVVDFSTNVTTGNAPLSVQFTDLSQNSILWSWDFNNDGVIDSIVKKPVYVYTIPGTYTVNFTAINKNGITSKTATINVLTENNYSDNSHSNNGGSSNGGSSHSSGGGGGGSPEPQKNVEVKELSQVFIANGKPIKFDFTQNATCVMYVSFNSKKTVGKTTTIVEQLKNRSTLVSNLTEGEVYKYFNIWVGNSGYATEKNIENAVVCFRVEKSWLQNNNIDQDSVTLNRYSNKTWEQLPVNLSGEDDKYVYFTTQTPGFSPFAITGEKTVKGTVAEIQPESNIGDTIGNNVSTALGIEQETDPKESASTLGFEIIYGIACMFGAFLCRRG